MSKLKDLAGSSHNDMPALDLDPVKKLFSADEQKMLPHIDESQLGRIRLIRAVKNKFGASYKAIPMVQDALSHYDREVKFLSLYKKTLGDRHGRNG